MQYSMLNIFNRDNILLLCIVVAVIIILAVLVYVYYRVVKKSNTEDSITEDIVNLNDKQLKSDIDELVKADDKNQEIKTKNSEKAPEEINYLREEIVSVPEENTTKTLEIIPLPQKEVKAEAEEKMAETEKTAATEITEIKEVKEAETVEKAEEKAINEVLYKNDKGGYIETDTDENGGLKFVLKSEKGKALGNSEPYQTKAGLLKGLKSLANYKETAVIDLTLDEVSETTANSKFEVSLCQDGKYCYSLKTKNLKTKFSGKDFKNKSDCIKAIEAVKNIGESFDL